MLDLQETKADRGQEDLGVQEDNSEDRGDGECQDLWDPRVLLDDVVLLVRAEYQDRQEDLLDPPGDLDLLDLLDQKVLWG
uniref:Uncharacterized protein n=1 Tax=Pithovirus LCPAC304 TaxID=2506594 RepID=A0A481Z8M8_9VIRU|nr:MAG: hypothetical protein LCPAC304_00680 [Pithovirus LCPAC304]